jgi:hypothetical protein
MAIRKSAWNPPPFSHLVKGRAYVESCEIFTSTIGKYEHGDTYEAEDQ